MVVYDLRTTHLVTFARRSSQVRSIHFFAPRYSERTVILQVKAVLLVQSVNIAELIRARYSSTTAVRRVSRRQKLL